MKKLFLIFLLSISLDIYSQTVVLISPCNNDLYQWVENPLTILIENTKCKNLITKTNMGSLSKNGCTFTYIIDSLPTTDVRISIGIKNNHTVKWIEDRFYKVKPLPFPKIKLISASSEMVTKSQINFNPHLFILDYSFGFEAVESKIYKLDTFSLSIVRNDSIIFKKLNIPGTEIPSDAITFINEKANADDLILFSNFRISIFSKEKRKSAQILTYKLLAQK